jgi:hypothetical protein
MTIIPQGFLSLGMNGHHCFLLQHLPVKSSKHAEIVQPLFISVNCKSRVERGFFIALGEVFQF